MTSALDHIYRARRELITDRERIDREIAVLDDVIRRLGGEVHAAVDASEAPSVKDIALEVARAGNMFTLQDVVEAARQQGSPAKYESISSVLSRLGKENVLRRGPRRGTYMLATRSDALDEPIEPVDTDAPAETGA